MDTETPTMGGNARMVLGAVLGQVLAHESRLAASTREYVWRIRGSPLQSVKRLFTEQSRQIDRWVEEISSCACDVGVPVVGVRRMDDALDSGSESAAARAAVIELLSRHEAIAGEIRVAGEMISDRYPEGDVATLLNALLEFHETTAWMLRLLLESPDRTRII